MKKSMVCAVVAAALACVSFASCGTKSKMVKIPGRNYELMNTEVTQKLYKEVMGENPSYYKGDNKPINSISWYDAIYFCNKMSEKFGYEPVYSVNGTTDESKWDFTPHKRMYAYHSEEWIELEVEWNKKANGFRLPTNEEWEYAAKAGEDFLYPGSDDIKKVAWVRENSGRKVHPVARKKPNAFGLYDMVGNVREMMWETLEDVDPDTKLENYTVCRGKDCNTYDGYYDWQHPNELGDGNLHRCVAGDEAGLRLARTVIEN